MKKIFQTSFYTHMAVALAFCSMSYEFLLAKDISFQSGLPVVWQPISIGAYLLGMGIGSFFFFRRKELFLQRFASIEFCLAIMGALSGFLLVLWHIVYRVYFYDATHSMIHVDISFVYFYGAGAQLIVAAIGFLTGFELPILIEKNKETSKASTIHILFWYQIGVLVAVFFHYFLTVNHVETIIACLVVSLVNLVAACVLAKIEKKKSLLFSGVVLQIILVGGLLWIAPDLLRFQVKNFYYNIHRLVEFQAGGEIKRTDPLPLSKWREIDAKYPDVERIRTKMQTIDLTENFKFDDSGQIVSADGRILSLDQHFQFQFSSEKDYHEHLAFVPMNIWKVAPKRVLVLGAGDGLLVRELLSVLPDLKVDLVEIDRGMIEFSRDHPHMKDLNKGSLESERVQIFTEDASHFLRSRKKAEYDAIYIDFPYPFTFDAARLFSYEFLTMVRKLVHPTGYVAMDAPYDLRFDNYDDMNQIIAATIYKAGFQKVAAYEGKSESFITYSQLRATQSLGFYEELDFTYETIPSNYFELGYKVRFLSREGIELGPHSIFKPMHMFFPDPRF